MLPTIRWSSRRCAQHMSQQRFRWHTAVSIQWQLVSHNGQQACTMAAGFTQWSNKGAAMVETTEQQDTISCTHHRGRTWAVLPTIRWSSRRRAQHMCLGQRWQLNTVHTVSHSAAISACKNDGNCNLHWACWPRCLRIQ